MEKHSRSIVEMATTCIDLPRFRLGHAPDFNETVVACRNKQRELRVERNPVYAAVVAFEDVLHSCIGVAKDIGSLGVVLLQAPLEHLFFERGDRVLRG